MEIESFMKYVLFVPVSLHFWVTDKARPFHTADVITNRHLLASEVYNTSISFHNAHAPPVCMSGTDWNFYSKKQKVAVRTNDREGYNK